MAYKQTYSKTLGQFSPTVVAKMVEDAKEVKKPWLVIHEPVVTYKGAIQANLTPESAQAGIAEVFKSPIVLAVAALALIRFLGR